MLLMTCVFLVLFALVSIPAVLVWIFIPAGEIEEGLKMTRKDFQLIAAALNRVYLDSIPSHAAFATACHAISLMADALATTDPRFDRERFILACKAS